MKKRVYILGVLLVFTIVMLTGCDIVKESLRSDPAVDPPVTSEQEENKVEDSAASETTFSKEGLTIVLPKGFKEMTPPAGQLAYYASGNSGAVLLKETFTSLKSADSKPENLTKVKYAELVIKTQSLSGSKVETKDGITFYKYERTVSGLNFAYFAAVFKADDAFWLVQFYCESKEYDTMLDDFVKWSKTVKV